MTLESLHGLADELGVETSYRGVDGQDHAADPDVLLAVLRARGAEIDGPDDAEDARLGVIARRWRAMLPPVSVVRGTEDRRVGLRLPQERASARIELAVDLEDGGNLSWTATPAVGRSVEIDGGRFVEAWVPVPLDVPDGVHRFGVEADDLAASGWLVVAPPVIGRAQERRGWGAFIPLHALRTARDRGHGDLTDLEHLADWLHGLGGTVAATLPILPPYLDRPDPDDPVNKRRAEPSPYSPVSRLLWNEVVADVTAAPELAIAPEAASLLDGQRFRDEVARLRSLRLVDHLGVWDLQWQVLRELADAALDDGPTRDAAAKFLDDHPHAAEYAMFRALVSSHGSEWWAWPDDPDVEEPGVERTFAYAQWLLERQMSRISTKLRDRGQRVYLDLPIGARRDGYDVWRYPESFAIPMDTGAPPDALFSGGQNWSFPPPAPEGQRRDGYAYLRGVLRHHLRVADLLRVDHVMGMYRLYWIPEGASAKDGVYVRYPADEIAAIMALEADRAGATLVGEDLGTVPDEVTHLMRRERMGGLHVGQYEMDGAHDPPLTPAPAGSVASANTHDMPPFAGYLSGDDIDRRVELGLTSRPEAEVERSRRHETIHRFAAQLRREGVLADHAAPDPAVLHTALLKLLGRGDADVVLANLEDLWGETEPQNIPGVADPRNWSRRARHSLEAVAEFAHVTAPLEGLGRARGTPQSTEGAAVTDSTDTKPDIMIMQDEDTTSNAVSVSEADRTTALGEIDLHLFNEGSHLRLYDKLGAHLVTEDGQAGVRFAVWAPNATKVSVIGEFNGWDPETNALEPVGKSGIWSAFVPEVEHAAAYKYRIVNRDTGYTVDKADPFATHAETPPHTGSKVWDLEYEWDDEGWMSSRGDRQRLSDPISIYELHLGSWRRGEDNRLLTYRELAEPLVEHIQELGFTHVEFLPVMEHPFTGSWGYQSLGYFAPTSRFGTPQDFMYLVDRLHQAGIGVILDWVPSHFPTDEHGLAYFDGTHLYEHADPRQGFHPDWSSAIFNYGRDEVRSFLLSSAMSWLDRYHIDGIRVDAVASMLYLDYSRKDGEWIPNRYGGNENLEAIDFLRRMNTEIYGHYPDVQTFAEESTAWPGVSKPTYVGGLGFGLKWDMGWMHDTLSYMQEEPIHRKYHQDQLTFRAVYAFSENYCLPLSHDEVVHGKGSLIDKMPGDAWQKAANLRCLLGYQFTTPGKKLLFMGQEFGQWREWNHEQSLDWHLLDENPDLHQGIQRWTADVAKAYRDIPALHERDCEHTGFAWVDASDREQSVISYQRIAKDGTPVVVILNLTPVPRDNYRVGVPHGGRWEEVLNSDAQMYGGSGVGNGGGVDAGPLPAHGHNHSVNLTLPPLGMLVLRGVKGKETVEGIELEES